MNIKNEVEPKKIKMLKLLHYFIYIGPTDMLQN